MEAAFVMMAGRVRLPISIVGWRVMRMPAVAWMIVPAFGWLDRGMRAARVGSQQTGMKPGDDAESQHPWHS